MTMRSDVIRGQSAVVGVADAVSPTGDLDITGRRLEATMIRGIVVLVTESREKS